jgi:hypothetical protein
MPLLIAALLSITALQPTVVPEASPFCSIVAKHVMPAILIEDADNDAIARIFPALQDYRNDLHDLNVSRTALAVYRLRRIRAQLQSDQPALRTALAAARENSADQSDRELLTQLEIATNSILAEQEGVHKALKAFIDDELSAEDATNGRVAMAGQVAENSQAGIEEARRHIQDVGSYLEMISAGAMSIGVLNDVAYARPMAANTQHIIDQEPYLHDLVALAAEHCLARRQASVPAPTPSPKP